MLDMSPNTRNIEDVFIKVELDEDKFWWSKKICDQQAREMWSMGQHDPEDEEVEKLEGDGLWQPGDPISDSESDGESTYDESMYGDIANALAEERT